jgi:hypothetical protein
MKSEEYPITALGISEPHPAQRRVLLADPGKSILFLGGRGSGKTVTGLARSIIQCMRPENAGQAFAIIAPTYRLLVRVHLKVLMQMLDAYKAHTGWSLIKRYYKHDQRIVLRNQCEIFLASFSNVDKIRSMTLGAGVYLDEIEIDRQPMETMSTIAGSIRGTEGTQGLLVTTTPRGMRGSVKHWIERTREGGEKFDPNYQMIISKTQENPYINQAFIDRLRSSMSKVTFQQEVLARVARASATALGNEWKRDVHCISFKYRKGMRYAIAVDPGYSNASVLFIAEQDRSDGPTREVIFREFHPEEQSFDKTIREIKAVVRELGTEPYMISSDRAIPQFNQKLIRQFPSAQIKTMRTREEQQVWAGIDRIRSLLDPQEGPPILYCAKHLIQTPKRGIVQSMENLRRRVVNGVAIDALDKSSGENLDHVMDALNYFVKGKYGRKGYTSAYDSGGAADHYQQSKGRWGKL